MECINEENMILSQLNWSLHKITPLHFIECLLGIIFEDDRESHGKTLRKIDEPLLLKMKDKVLKLADFCI
jgi:uncharacterized protein (DUF1499 family)